MMEKKRSKGIVILGTFLLVCLLPALMAAFIAAISGPGPSERIHGPSQIRLVFILSPVAFLLAGIGVLALKNWARVFTIIVCSVMTLLIIGLLFLSTSVDLLPLIFFLAIVIIFTSIIYYLTRPKVKRQFTGAES
jgi:hypothetical protein